MNTQKIPFRQTHAFSEAFLKYIEKDHSLSSFYGRFPAIESFRDQINDKAKSFPASARKTLSDTLRAQYGKLLVPGDAVSGNISALSDSNTFTVTTGHQLNVCTGPLYFIYKIITVIEACKRLKKQYPERNFVPVYWMASEDHDYEEIKSFRLYGRKYTWETSQHGAVGRFHLKDIPTMLAEVPGEIDLFKSAYQNATLAAAVRQYVHKLFGEEGLVVLDADHPALKQALKPVMEEDLFRHEAFKKVTQTQQALGAINFHAPVNPREINFFYLDDQLRSRIERQGNEFVVVDTNLKFTEKEIREKIEHNPEKFSPNVILRPLYQEMILPNLAYVGGPAELVYWLELKGYFDHRQIPFPILLPRNFAMVIEDVVARKLSKTGLPVSDYFEEKNFLFNHWISLNSAHNLSLGKMILEAEKMFAGIEEQSARIDPTLSPMVKAEAKRTRDKLEKIEKKMLRAEKRLHADRLRQIEEVKDILFPGGSLQERTDNFLNFYQKDPGFIKAIMPTLDPFDFRFHILHRP